MVALSSPRYAMPRAGAEDMDMDIDMDLDSSDR
jgi:hypothetical protein